LPPFIAAGHTEVVAVPDTRTSGGTES